MSEHRSVLAALAIGFLGVATVALFEVVGTVFLAITVAYLLVPLQRRVLARGVHEWWSALAVTVGTTLALFVPLAAATYLVYVRLPPVISFLRDLPATITVTAAGVTRTVALADVVAEAAAALQSVALGVVRAIPVLGLKLTLFAILVFAMLRRHDDAEAAVLAPIPARYHDVAASFGHRARETLFAIYVLQAATAIGTFVIAVPVFVALGYAFPFTLALVAAVLQFLPIVGPSVLILALAAWQATHGSVASVLAVLVGGGVLVAWLPDVLIRPRLSARTARLPGSLYFVGFTGGLLTLGAIGVVAGPLAIALAVHAMELLAEQEDGTHQTQLG